VPTPASTSGCILTALGVPDGPPPDEGVLAATVLAPLTDFLDDAPVLAAVLEAGGEVMILAAPGVGIVVHCHSPSALTQA
jgi:hypothetical protein